MYDKLLEQFDGDKAFPLTEEEEVMLPNSQLAVIQSARQTMINKKSYFLSMSMANMLQVTCQNLLHL